MQESGARPRPPAMEITLKLKHTLAAGIAAIALLATSTGAFAALGITLDDTEAFESADGDSEVAFELDEHTFVNVIHCKGGEYCLVRADDGEGYVAAPDLALVNNAEDFEDEADDLGVGEDDDDEDEDDEEADDDE
jgi:hypothetical protein